MAVDGHFPKWGLAQPANDKTLADTLDFFMQHFAAAPTSDRAPGEISAAPSPPPH